jgi:intracellular septation protein
MTADTKRPLNPYLKLAIEMGPLLLFFVTNFRPQLFLPLVGPALPASIIESEHMGLFVATAVLMVATLVSLVVSYALTRHLPVMAMVTLAVVLVFGGLTLYLQNETFIKMKPTVIYLLFGGVLLGGYIFDKPFLTIVFDAAFHLTEEGWRKLTLRWAVFFLFLALVNEIVWRTQPTNVWVTFKTFGIIPLIFLFAALQYPLLQKYEAAKEE